MTEIFPGRSAVPEKRSRAGALSVAASGVVAVAVSAIAAIVATGHPAHRQPSPASVPGSVAWHQHHPVHTPPLPSQPLSYLGVYEPGAPRSYAAVNQFAVAAARRPDIALYYSGWWVPFKSRFADEVRANGAVPAVQIDPDIVSPAGIAAGKYDDYLRSYADQVATYGHPVIIGFGHEMNGWWYPWGYRHTSPAVFVAAWRHIVNVFRQQGADNVTWLWTINIMDTRGGSIPAPAPWWPGSSYVTWVGIDGYYLKPSWMFASLFGPTIKAVRALSRVPFPILVSETGVAPAAGKPAKIDDLFAGIRAYGLLGFIWFDANKVLDWRLDSPAALAAFRRGARTYKRPAS
jgi:glycosyl hydrolase family 26